MLFVSTQIMLTSGETVTVYYLTEEGKKKLESLLSTNLNCLSNRVDLALETVNKIRDELVRTVFLEKMQVHIIKSLKESPNQTQQMVAKNLPDFSKNPMHYHAFHEAWKQFEKAGVIVPTSHGQGHPRTWQVSI